MKIDGNVSNFLTPASEQATEAAKRANAGAPAMGAPVAETPALAADASSPSAIVHASPDPASMALVYDRLAQMPKAPPAPAAADLTPDGAADLLKQTMAALRPMQAEGKLDSLVSQSWVQAFKAEA